MIGIAYLARHKSLLSLVCIKRMMGEQMHARRIFHYVSQELDILKEVAKIEGCIQLIDVIWDSESLNLVFPYFPRGDLRNYIKSVKPASRALSEQQARPIFKQLV